jgi:hypothetical protein
MSSERPGKSHAVAWTLSILAAVVLYVMSVTPLSCICLHGKYGSRSEIPDWFIAYAAPADWLYEHTPPLQQPLDAYADWVRRVMR